RRSPGVTARSACATAPSAPTEYPCPPIATTCSDFTPAGTVSVCSEPVEANVAVAPTALPALKAATSRSATTMMATARHAKPASLMDGARVACARLELMASPRTRRRDHGRLETGTDKKIGSSPLHVNRRLVVVGSRRPSVCQPRAMADGARTSACYAHHH